MFSKPKTPVDVGLKREKRRLFWQKARRRAFWTLAVFFVLHSALNIYTSVQLNHELSAIRQKGQPLQFSELAPPAVPDAQNAALIYQQASDSLKLSRPEDMAFKTRRSNRSAQEQQTLESALRKNQKAIDLARKAAFMPQCRFPLDWNTSNPSALVFPHYGKQRELAHLLSEQALVEARQGQSRVALRDVRAIFGIAHHLSLLNEPVLIGFLVAQGIDGIGHQTLAQVLETTPLTVPEARAFQLSLPVTDWRQFFRRVMMGERAWGIFAFEMIRKPSPESFTIATGNPPPAWLSYPLVLLWQPALKMDQVQTLRLWKVQIDNPLAQQIPRPPSFNLDDYTKTIPFYALFTRMLFPVFSRASDNRDVAYVRRSQREIALALTCYRTARGPYPKQLSELASWWGSPLPVDLYSKKSFIYRRVGRSFLLYSVGVNREDNQGIGDLGLRAPSHRPEDYSKDDIVWNIARR